MILRTVFGAIIGAAFGYIMGLIIELFPRFNAALLEGLHAITGLGGVRTAALLAAVGFLAGVLSGLLHGLACWGLKRHWYTRWSPWRRCKGE
jgi:MFS family permease